MINLRDLKFRIVYWIVNKLDKYREVHFMNYGYHDPDCQLKLDRKDETNRYSIQLYNHLTELIEIKDKDLVEVGSGRGGGLSFIAKYLSPRSLKGIDLCRSAIDTSNKNNVYSNLTFHHGNALQMPLKSESCDVLINVESSHRYLEMDLFISEVKRLLRKGGHMLFTDFRFDYEWAEVHRLFELSGMKILQ